MQQKWNLYLLHLYLPIITEDVDENIECISPKLLNTMSDDVAKLKAKQALDSIPKNKLTLLINYAMRNVYLARNYSAGPVRILLWYKHIQRFYSFVHIPINRKTKMKSLMMKLLRKY